MITYGMRHGDTSVQDVGASAGTCGVVVGVGGAAGGRAGDKGKAPWSVVLGDLDGEDGILLGVVDGGVVAEGLKLLLDQGGGEARETLGVGEVSIGSDGGDGGGDGVLLHANNVVALDELSIVKSSDSSRSVTLDGRKGGHGHGDESEESRGRHIGGIGCVVWKMDGID